MESMQTSDQIKGGIAQGEDLHLAVWPGRVPNAADSIRFAAREARSSVVSACGLMRARYPDFMARGGSCLAGPDVQWILEPGIGEETLLLAAIDHGCGREARQNAGLSIYPKQ